MRIYLCAGLLEWLIYLVIFAVMYGAGARGLSVTRCAWLSGIFQVTYMVTSLGVGLALTRRNARPLVLISTAACILLGALGLLITSFVPLLLALSLLGCAMAVFFNAFQTFMRCETSPGHLAHTVGLFTLAWSLGCGMGFLSSGLIYRLGPNALVGMDLLVGLGIYIALLTHTARPTDAPSAAEQVEPVQSAARPVNPAYVWVGWISIFTAAFIQRSMLTFFPSLSGQSQTHAFLASLPLFLHMIVQGTAGLFLITRRHWLYHRTPLLIFHGVAAAVFLLMWQWPAFPVLFIGISLIGLYTGFGQFVAVYYAASSGQRAFNIGVNEWLVGLGAFTGLMIAGWWLKHTGEAGGMYLVFAIALLISIGLQFMASLRRESPTPRASPLALPPETR